MSTDHGPITQKPISEIAKFIKDRLPTHIPATYALKPRLESVANEEDIRNGVIAYRDFLLLLCDRLISDGDQHIKPQPNPKSATDYPFLYHITDLLADIGYHGTLNERRDALLISEIPSFAASVDGQGNLRKAKNPVTKLAEYLRFLSLCGFTFAGIDLAAKTPNITEAQPLLVSYPNAPVLLTGLKALSIADIELRTKRYVSDDHHDNLLRCDYRLLQAEDPDALDILRDFVRPLPEQVQDFAVELHRRYTERGMTCATLISTFETHIAYANMKNNRRERSPRELYQRRTWEFALSAKTEYALVVRAKKMDRYPAVIEQFPLPLQEKIAKGYGCDRKLRNEPCQRGCQGFVLPLDGSLVNMRKDIETWLDHEVSG